MHPADAAPLLDAPGAATYAVFVSDTGAQRIDDVTAIAPCFEHALGGLLGAEGAGVLDGILSGWAKGRGDWDTAALVTAAPPTGVVFRAPVADADAATRSLHDLTGLVEHPPVSDAVQQLFGVLQGTSTETDLPPFGKTTTLTFPRVPNKKGKGAPEAPLGLAWTTSAGEIDLGIGAAPADLLASLRQTPRLGGDLATANAIHALGSNATFAVVLKPFDCCMKGGPTATPLTFGWGRRGEQGWIRVEMGYELLDKFAQGL
jgi:hypothetical protein